MGPYRHAASDRDSKLIRAVESVLAQDYEAVELIVVNDRATEPIDDFVRSFGIAKYRKNDRNRGLPYSLNRGFEEADGEYHTWTSADNFMLPGMVSRLVREMEERRDLAVVCGKSRYIDATDRLMNLPDAEVACAKLSCCDLRSPYVEARYTYYGSLGACFLYRKEAWEQLEGYDENLHGSEDFDFWIRASRTFRMGRIPWEEDPLYVYRVHSDSISANVAGCFTKARLAILQREAQQYPRDTDLRKAIQYYTRFAGQQKGNRFRRALQTLRNRVASVETRWASPTEGRRRGRATQQEKEYP